MEDLNKLGTHNVKPASALCPACTSPVYLAEGWIAADRTPFHKACLKCRRCRKMLNALTINEHRDHLYCKPCYHMVFMEKVKKIFVSFLYLAFFLRIIWNTHLLSMLELLQKKKWRRRKRKRERGLRRMKERRMKENARHVRKRSRISLS